MDSDQISQYVVVCCRQTSRISEYMVVHVVYGESALTIRLSVLWITNHISQYIVHSSVLWTTNQISQYVAVYFG